MEGKLLVDIPVNDFVAMKLTVRHKVGNVDIFVLLKFENKIAREICHSDYNSKHYDKCKFDLKLIKFLTVSNLQVGTSVNSTRHDC